MAKNNSYWESRVQKIYDKRVEELAVDILYRRVYEDTAKQVRELYEDSKDRKLTRTELYRSAKFLSWRRDLKKQLKGISGEVNDKLEKTLTKAYKDAGLAAKDSIGKKSVWTVQNREMAKACINREWAGDSFSGRIWKNRDKLARTVERGIVNTIITGTGKNELIKELTDLKYRDRFTADPSSQLPIEQQYEAYLQRGRRQANTLVRTELMHTLNTAQIETYKSEGVNYLAFECEPTACSKCRDIASGNPYKIDSIPCTLGHPNCRCTWLAVEDEDVGNVRRKFKHDITKPNTAENVDNSRKSGIIKEEETLAYRVEKAKAELDDLKRQFYDKSGGFPFDFVDQRFQSLEQFCQFISSSQADGSTLGVLKNIKNKIDNVKQKIADYSDKLDTIKTRKILDEFPKIKSSHTYADDIRATNPGFIAGTKEYTYNCQRCVSAYEARRRGYDVTAKSLILNGNDRLQFMNDEKGWPNVYRNGRNELVDCFSNSGDGVKKKAIRQMNAWGDGSRAIVGVQWRNSPSGHVFIAENHSGEIKFIDPQSGELNVEWYFNMCKVNQTRLLRIDDKDFTALIDECCEH